MSELGTETLPSEAIYAVETPPITEPSTFRDVPWSLSAIAIGLLGLIALRCISFFDWSWLAQFPVAAIVVYVALAFLPQVAFLVYPLIMRPRRRLAGEWPSFWQLLAESSLAFGVVLVTTVFFYLIEIVLVKYWPNATLTPREFSDMAYAPNVIFFAILLFMFTFVPIAEEMFFRGFLHNAFRQRMPLAVAILVQSAIFGFVHSYSLAHSLAAVLMGVILTLVYEWRKTLLTPILIHAGINFIAAVSVVAMMVQVANTPVLGVGGEGVDERCVVRTLVPGSPAEQAGLQVGDIITDFNGEPIRDFRALQQQVVRYRPGNQIPIIIERDGEALETSATLMARNQLMQPPK